MRAGIVARQQMVIYTGPLLVIARVRLRFDCLRCRRQQRRERLLTFLREKAREKGLIRHRLRIGLRSRAHAPDEELFRGGRGRRERVVRGSGGGGGAGGGGARRWVLRRRQRERSDGYRCTGVLCERGDDVLVLARLARAVRAGSGTRGSIGRMRECADGMIQNGIGLLVVGVTTC